MTVGLFVCSPLLSCSKFSYLPPEALAVKLDSKDFLTDPAVYYAVFKFQKF